MFGKEESEGTIVSVEKWLTVNKEATYKRIMRCNNAVELRNITKYLCGILCKLENKICNI